MPAVQWTSIYPDGAGSAAAGSEWGAGGGGADAGNPLYPGMPVGATPVHKDIVIAAAGANAIWTPLAGNRFILASAFISTDAAMRVALVDDLDIQGQRPVDGYFGANGGASPNLVPVPYPAKAVGNSLKVVTSAAGNVRVRVSGWEVPG